MKNILKVGALAASLIAGVSVAQAQSPIGIGISAGAAMPTSNTTDVQSAGYNFGASLFVRSLGTPLALRFDGLYGNLGGKTGGITRPDLTILGANGNLQWTLGGDAVKAYAVGGAGVYATKYADSNRSGTRLGWNGGLGVTLPLSGFNTFVEARYHFIRADDNATIVANRAAVKFIPITFGIMF